MIQLKDISLLFGEKVVLEGFNLIIEKGEKVAIRGRSGIGKTSILNLILGFIKPNSGEIIIDGAILNKQSIRKIRQKIAWLPQNFNVIGSGKVSSIIQFPFTFQANKHNKPAQNKINEYLKLICSDENILENSLENLSGGERQRIGLLICKLLDRDIILLDEPTSALDKDTIIEVAEFMLKDDNKTVLSVSHNDEWIKYCTRIIEL